MKQLWNFFITKLFPSPPIRRGWKSIYEPLWTLLDQFYLINLSTECKYSHKSSYLLCSFLEYGGGCITPMELTLAVTRRVLIFRLPSCSCTSRHPKANYSLTHTLAVSALMPLSLCRLLAADNRCASGIRAAFPEHVPLFTLTSVC